MENKTFHKTKYSFNLKGSLREDEFVFKIILAGSVQTMTTHYSLPTDTPMHNAFDRHFALLTRVK